MPTFAVSEKQGMDALKAQFMSGEAELDYVYYSPAGKNDDMKYPLVVWLHGNSSGDYPGHQLDNCSIALWSSEEYQSRFEGTGGAYLLLPRYPTSGLLSVAWEGTTNTLKKTIDAFVKEHRDNIDVSRIYIGGYSMGGKMTLRMAMTYPTYFAAAFPLSPVYAPSNADLNNLIDVPLWFFWCKNDDYTSLNPITVNANWQYLMNISNCKAQCRISTFDTIYNSDYTVKTADGKKDIHNTWDAACHDLFMDDNKAQKGMTTKDGNGKTINLTYPEGLIYWLSCQSKAPQEQEGESRRTILDILYGLVDIIKNAIVDIIKAIANG
jgi:predicted peptidase